MMEWRERDNVKGLKGVMWPVCLFVFQQVQATRCSASI